MRVRRVANLEPLRLILDVRIKLPFRNDALKIVIAGKTRICPSCGFSISPAEVVRVDCERVRCPQCWHVFEAGSPKGGIGSSAV